MQFPDAEDQHFHVPWKSFLPRALAVLTQYAYGQPHKGVRSVMQTCI